MLFDRKPFTFDSVISSILKILAVAGFILALHFLRDVLVPFAVALLLAYLTDPLVRVIQYRVRSRSLAVLITLVGVVLFIAALFSVIIPAIVSEVSHAAMMTSDFFNNSQIAERMAQYLPQGIWQAVKDWVLSPEIQNLIRAENIIRTLEALSQNVLPGAWGLITGTANVLVWVLGIAFVLLYLVFILLDFEKLRRIWKELIPVPYREDIAGFLEEFNGALHKYFRAQAAIAGIVGILFAIGFEVISLPMGVLLGLFVGLLNLIPYLQILGFVPAILLAIIHAIQNDSSIWGMIGLTLLVFIIVQTIQETILVPRIMNKSTGLSPAIVLLSLTIWAKLLGFLGLIIALPMTYLIYTYYMRYLAKSSDISYEPLVREIGPQPERPPREKTLTAALIDKLRPGDDENEDKDPED